MIKINLYQRKAAVGVSAGTGQTEAGLKGFNSVFARFKGGGGAGLDALSASPDLKTTIILAVVYIVILAGASFYISGEKSRRLEALDAEISVVKNKLTLLSSELSKTQGYEATKKNLETDERKIRAKIDTIQELVRDRSVPPRILMGLSDAVPKEVWLKDFSLKDKTFKIQGNSNSMDVVSDFIKSLSESIYFKDVQLKSSKSDPGAKLGREVTNFELEAQRR